MLGFVRLILSELVDETDLEELAFGLGGRLTEPRFEALVCLDSFSRVFLFLLPALLLVG